MSRRCPPRRAFTLIELITAASLMTLMMLGVVQIFGIITETASQAQGAAFAMEQGRALLDTLHRDIRGFNRDGGYIKIQESDIFATGVPGTFIDPGIPTIDPLDGLPVMAKHKDKDYTITWYASDCLALTTVGYFAGQKSESNKATGAEVVYTSNVRTPTNRFELVDSGGKVGRVDPRRGVLARAAWLLSAKDTSTGQPVTGATSDTDDVSAAAVLADLGSGQTADRLTKAGGAVSPVQVTPLLTSGGALTGGNLWQLRRVGACCLSEFMVETLETSGATTSWTRRNWTVKPIKDPTDSTTDRECPRAIRVTIAIHDPSDRKPSTGASGRFEGFALQEIFWISDP